MSIKSMMASDHLIFCHPLLLLSIFPSIRVFSNESVLRNSWPKSHDFCPWKNIKTSKLVYLFHLLGVGLDMGNQFLSLRKVHSWVWVNSGHWWWTGRPGVLQSMGLQRVGHDWATELNRLWVTIHSKFSSINQHLVALMNSLIRNLYI